jgi:diguanylate cyclase (GGDEF)-like protein
MTSPESDILIIAGLPMEGDFLDALLTGEGFLVKRSASFEEAREILGKQQVSLVVCDYNCSSVKGIDVCKYIRGKYNLRHLSVILMMSTKDPMDKIKGIYAGADDYVEKPFEPGEFLARVKGLLVRKSRDLDANPLTKLPGNISVLKELETRLHAGEPFAAAYLDLNKFKEFNDRYGFEMGDQVILHTSQLVIRALERSGNPGDFLGHIGGDDFIYISTPEKAEEIAKAVVAEFDTAILPYFNEEDRKRGYLVTKSRTGMIAQVPLLSVSIAIMTNESRKFTHVGEISQVAVELKQYAKSKGGSVYVTDRRKK